MKCEIIQGKFYIEAGTPTEQWALNQMIDSMASYHDPRNYIVDVKSVAEVTAPTHSGGVHYQIPTPPPPVPFDQYEEDELDAIFGPK